MVFNVQPLNDEEIMDRFELYAFYCQDESLTADEMPGKPDEQLSESDFQSLPQSAKSEEKLLDIAFYLVRNKRFEELKTIMHQALEYLPTHPYFRLYLALAYYYSGEYLVALSLGRSIDLAAIVSIEDEAAPSLKEMDCECPGCSDSSSDQLLDLSGESKIANEVQALFRDIHQLKQIGDYDQAISNYLKFFAQIGEPPCLLVDLASLYFKVKNYKEAKKTYARALEVNPGLYDAFRKLAATHRLLDEYELAVGVLKKAHKQFPKDDMILLELAAGYFKLGHVSKAVDSLEKALTIDPSIEHSLVSMPDMAYLLNLLHENKSAVHSS